MKKLTRKEFASKNHLTYMRKNDPIQFSVIYNEYSRKWDWSGFLK
jgi:hypothetical protein